MKQIDVVCALILDDKKRLLTCKRGPNQSHSGKWEFPGGKIKTSETPQNALIREIREELQVTIKVISALPPVTHDYPAFRVFLRPYLCTLSEYNQISLIEHSEFIWFNPKKKLSPDMEWTEADIPILKQYLKSL